MLTGRPYPRGQGFVELTVGEDGVGIHRHVMDRDGKWSLEEESPD